MLLRNHDDSVKDDKELIERVTKRIVKANPEKSVDDARRQAKRAIKDLERIQDLPSYSAVINMNHL